MHRRALFAVLSIVAALLAAPAASAGDASAHRRDRFELYTAVVSAKVANALQRRFDHDVVSTRQRRDGKVQIDLIANGLTRRKLAGQGIRLTARRNGKGQTYTQAAFAAQQAGHSVFDPYSGAGGIQEQLAAAAAAHPGIAELVAVGTTVKGQTINAVRVTKNPAAVARGSRPAALYLGAQHAREWITPEMVMRLMNRFLSGYGSDSTLTSLVNANEYWFMPVANPDGYDYTFTEGNRLWRKNLRDNNNDGQISADVDGVDPNRNFPTRWGYDNEGSADVLGDATYRGTAPASEPETQALDNLMRTMTFQYLVNYHSAAELLLYGIGWQVQTASPDDIVYEALAGDDADPAIPGYDPDVSSELYTTNGETTEHAQVAYGTLAFTPEMSTCQTVSADDSTCDSVFNFPDDEELVEQEYTKNIAFAMDVAKSVRNPDHPVSHLGNTTPDFVLDPFAVSYGDPQPVAVWARRSLAPFTLRYQINDGPFVTVPATEWGGGERYGVTNDVYYAEYRGTVAGTKPGDKVTYFFTGAGGKRSDRTSYRAAVESANRVLILANEDYSGPTPNYARNDRPAYLQYYKNALADLGISYDVYDVDARKRIAPHHLGVLSHYDAVVWYTGDDFITREPGQKPGTGASKLANDMVLAVRDYMNEHGKLVFTGQRAGEQYATPFDFNPQGQPPYCPPTGNATTCIPLSDDFLQYYLGAWKLNPGAGMSGTTANPVTGSLEPFSALGPYTLNGADSAANQRNASSFLATSSFLDPAKFPQFQSRGATMDYVRDGGAPYEPHTGSRYAYSQNADVAYKRLTQTVSVPAGGGQLRFWISADTEPNWDYVVVEAHTPGQNDWTTLPAPGLTTQSTGDSCPEGWRDLHPQLDYYQTRNADGTCSATGTAGGQWHGLTGSTHGWKEWVSDLSAYSGKDVELSISYITDWGTQGLGVFLDDISVPGGTEGFESGLGAWVPGKPDSSPLPNANNWISTTTAFDEGAAVSTVDSHYFGFGLEGVTGRAARAQLLGTALDDLL